MTMISHLDIIRKMVKNKQCNDAVRFSLISCLAQLSNIWAMYPDILPLSRYQGNSVFSGRVFTQLVQ